MPEKGANEIGHVEDLMLLAELHECDSIGLQETRRNGRVSFSTPVAGYATYCSGYSPGDEGKPGQLCVKLVVKDSTVRAAGPEGIVVTHIRARLMKVCVTLIEKCVVPFVVGHSPTEKAATLDTNQF